MKTLLRHIALLMIGLLALASCTEVGPLEPVQSGFVVSLQGDARVQTKMTPAELGAPVARHFNLRVTNTRTNRVVYEGAYQEFVAAATGQYLIEAYYGQDVEIGINAPYYYGQATAAITAEEPEPAVRLTCSVANSLVSVKYLDLEGAESRELFDYYFSAYCTNVTRGSRSAQLYSDVQSAYFPAGCERPALSFTGTLRGTGREVHFDFPTTNLPASLAAADHLVLSLSLTPTTSGVILQVAKASIQTATIEETIPVDWLPKPHISAFGGDGVMSFIETTEPTEEATIGFSTSRELQDLEIGFQFADEPLASALNGTYTLSTLTPEQAQLLASYGLTLPDIGTRYTNGTLDLRGMVRHLLTRNGVTVDNTVSLRVKANNRWSSETPETFVVSAVRPVFNMSAQQTGYAWAHSLYVSPITAADVTDAKGADPAALSASAVYDISADGGNTWTQITGQANGLYYQTGLNPNTDYTLRARIGSVMVSSTTVTAHTETENAVPNGDFETLQTTINNLQINEGGKYAVNFIVQASYQNYSTITVSEPSGWASVNSKTCCMSAANQNTWYMVPSTLNTTLSYQTYNDFKKANAGNPLDENSLLDAQSGSNAMIVRNVAWDTNGPSIAKSGGTANTKYWCENIPTVANRSSGKLFLGSYSYSSNGVESYNEGTAFSTRPTSLNGYFKYMKDGDDSEYGTATVEVLNGNTVIGIGSLNFSENGSFAAFSVPLTYSEVVLPATSLRIMFTSSRYASHTQSVETANVKTTNYCIGGTTTAAVPGKCYATGATLVVDNLSFTYGK